MKPFTIGALSKGTGCHIETIRYYERIVLLPEPPRSQGGHRLYEEAHLRRLAFIRRSRELGFTLEEYIDSILQLHAIVSGLESRHGGYGRQPAQATSSSNGSAGSAGMAGRSPDSEHLGLELGQVQGQQAPVRVSGNPSYRDGVVRGYGEFDRLDANLVSNLMRWAGTVQAKIGQDQLETLLRVYNLTGNLPPAVERMLLKAAQLETLPRDSDGAGFTLQDFIDSLLKLHGIVHSTEYQPGQGATEFTQHPAVIRDTYG